MSEFLNHENSFSCNSNIIGDESIKLDDLPYDILLNILERLSYKDLNQLAQVNKKINLIANDNFLWKLKLVKDIHVWNLIDSKTYPKELFKTKQISMSNSTASNHEIDEQISYKKIYLNACPDLITKKEILEKLETFQHVQNELHLTSTSESINITGNDGINATGGALSTNNLTLSALSSLVMPRAVFGQIKDFIYRNVFNTNPNLEENSSIPKLVMFGPGLETTTSCLVTNILWKSEFKTIGMIPGRDGYGSGIKLKLFNHKPFNLTILYTNVSKVRNSNNNHDVSLNRLIVSKTNDDTSENIENKFELHPQVREACSSASGFIYVVDNKHLAALEDSFTNNLYQNIHNLNPLDNYRLELNVLMKEVNKDLPLLILGCNVDMKNDSIDETKMNQTSLSCVKIIEKLELFDLNQEWQIRNCNLFQHKLKDIVLGFEWILNKLDQKFLLKQYKAISD